MTTRTLREAQRDWLRLANGALVAELIRDPGQRLAKRLQRKARRNATRKPRVRTGALRRSIRAEAIEERGDLVIALYAGEAPPASAYAAAQEYGTRWIPATRYLGRALDNTRREFDSAIRDSLRDLLTGGR